MAKEQKPKVGDIVLITGLNNILEGKEYIGNTGKILAIWKKGRSIKIKGTKEYVWYYYTSYKILPSEQNAIGQLLIKECYEF